MHDAITRLFIDGSVAFYTPGLFDEMALWQRLIKHGAQAPSCATVLNFNARVRLLFATYPQEGLRIRLLDADDRELGVLGYEEVSECRISGWFAALLNQAVTAFGQSGAPESWQLLGDERARVLATLIPAGSPPPPVGDDWEVLVSRLAGADPWDTEFMYAPETARADLAAGEYGRFRHLGTRYVATSHSFVMVAHGGFARDHLKDHMATMYRRMFLLVHGYDAALTDYGRRLAAADDIADLRRSHLAFRKNLWFEDVSSQIQGRELYQKMIAQLPLQREQEEIQLEIGVTDELDRLAREERTNKITVTLAVVAISFAAVSVFADSLTGMKDLIGESSLVYWIWAVGLAILVGIIVILIPPQFFTMARQHICERVTDVTRSFRRWLKRLCSGKR